MNKQQVVQYLADRNQVPQTQIRQFLDSYLELIRTQLCSNSDFKLGDIGTLKVVERAERTVSNPQDPTDTIEIPAHFTVRLNVFKSFKEDLNFYLSDLTD